jgi:SAM-dependent methyltransferase
MNEPNPSKSVPSLTASSFAEKGYRLDPDTSVWVSEHYQRFAYSDGEAQERYVYEAIQSSQDVSYASDELPAKIKDWPSEYHLSPVRGNLVAPLQIKAGKRVLELGCGMGAITRRMGETGAEVVAIEGSIRRAATARARCRDLPNVQVVCDNFKDFAARDPFDIVTLIGVMEYSPKFIGGSDPVGTCLSIAKRFLKPDGSLIIAIENRLGLKYWNNCGEDHTGGAFDSIHDTYRPNLVMTFGYEELKRLLADAGFVSAQFLFPFPDYKTPSVIVPERALNETRISFATIIGQPFARDYSGQPYRHFSERLAWQSLEKNGLIPHLANSFLCVCAPSRDAQPLFSDDWFAKIYNSSRRACFRTETTIYPDQTSRLLKVKKERVHAELPVQKGLLAFNPNMETDYVEGSMLSDEIQKALLRHADLDPFFLKMVQYKEAVESNAKKRTPKIPYGYCPRELVDCTPFNLIRDKDGALHYIDDEWISEKDVPMNYVVLRGLVAELTAKIRYLDTANRFAPFPTLKDLAVAVFKAIGLPLSDLDIDYYCRTEALIQSQITGARGAEKAMEKHYHALFSAPLGNALGVTAKLSVIEICKLLSSNARSHPQPSPSSTGDCSQDNASRSTQVKTAENAVRIDDCTVTRGEQLYQSGEVEASKACFRKILEASPQNVDALNNLGCIAYQEGKLEQAIAWLEQGLQINPEHANLLLNLGQILATQGAHARALTYLKKALQVEPENVPLLNACANCLVQAGAYGEAKELFARSYRLDGTQVEVENVLGELKRINELSRPEL